MKAHNLQSKQTLLFFLVISACSYSNPQTQYTHEAIRQGMRENSSPASTAATSTHSATPPGSEPLCATNEGMVFGCHLAHVDAQVALCVDKVQTQSARYVFYQSGSQNIIQSSDASTVFRRNFLSFAGGVGGHAYSITTPHEKIILFSIAGPSGFQDSGMITLGGNSPVSREQGACDAKSYSEGDFKTHGKTITTWPVDDALDRLGLPD